MTAMKQVESAELSDQEFLAKVEEATIAAGDFDHVAHVRAAFLLLRDSTSFAMGLDRMSRALKRITEQAGVPGKYHETITVAFMALVHERMASAPPEESWPAFIERNRDLVNSNPLGAYYSHDQLADPLARRVFVLPIRNRSAA
jgi:hypothetical protein